MKKGSTVFLQAVVVVLGIFAFLLMLWEPRIEGRNMHATLFQIYFTDPFLIYAYIASIAFFIALYQAFKLLGYVGRNEVFSQAAVKALRTIKHCALVLIAFIAGGEAYIWIFVGGMGGIAGGVAQDDIAGGVMIGLFLMFMCAVVATAAAVFEKTLQSAVDLKSENDLTV
jgi:hypothetical protein